MKIRFPFYRKSAPRRPGFAPSRPLHFEDEYADSYAGQKIQPFWIQSEGRKLPNTNFIVNNRFREFAVRDGRLTTGQRQYSGAAVARLIVEALGR